MPSGVSTNTVVANFWQLTNLIISPSSIVGGGNNSDGTPQSFQLTPVINLGLPTAVNITYNPNFAVFGTSVIVFPQSIDLNQGASQSGFYSGFSTTFPTKITFIATGPTNTTLTTTNVFVNPFLFSNSVLLPVWGAGIATTSTNFQYAGIGATYQDTVYLNAYIPAGSLQTAIIGTPDPNLYFYTASGRTPAQNGILTFYGPQNVGIISFGYTSVAKNTSITTTVTLSLLNSTGITTTFLTFQGINTYSYVLEPIMPGRAGNAYYSGGTYYPLPLAFNWIVQRYNSAPSIGSTTLTLPLGVASFYQFTGAINTSYINFASTSYLDQKLVFSINSIYLDTLDNQSYFVDYYYKQGSPKAMGFDLYGELGQGFTSYIQPPGNATGQGVGTYSKIYMNLPNVVKTASGSNHNLALTTSGIVYAIGNNTFYQLNVPTAGIATNIFTRIGTSGGYTDQTLNTIFTDIYAQNNSSYIISANRNLYAFGQNNYNQLGFNSNGIGFASMPTLVANNVELISVFNNRGVIKTYNNNYDLVRSIYEFGAMPSIDGSNGAGSYSSLTLKTDLGIISYNGTPITFSSININAIDVGTNHTLAACTFTNPMPNLGFTSAVVAWGWNNNYQLGTSISTGYISVPQILTKYNNSGSVSPLDYTTNIIAGNQWSLAITSNNGINSTYFYGPGSSVYYGGWISYTGVNTSIGVGQSFFNDSIYKIAKSKDHIVWLTGLGSVYVSGGAARLYLKNITNTSYTYQGSMVYIDGAPNNIPETQAFAYYPQAGIYTINYYGSTASGLQTSNSGITKITSSISTSKSSVGIDILMVLFNNNEIHTWAYYYSGGISTLKQINNSNGLPDFSVYAPSNNIVDVGVGKSYISFGGGNFIVPSFIASYSSYGIAYTNTITTFFHYFNLNNTYSSFSVLPYLSTINEQNINSLAAGMFEGRLEKITTSGTTYDWISSNYNIVAGYADGLISIFSDANVGFGTLITNNDPTQRLIAQFAPISNTPITAMKVIYSRAYNSNLLITALGNTVYYYKPKTLSEYNEGNWHLLSTTVYPSSQGSVLTIMNASYVTAGSSVVEYAPLIFSNGYIQLAQINGPTTPCSYNSLLTFTTPFSVFVTNNPSSGKSDGNFVQFIATEQNVQEWYFPFDNFEIGLNYWNYNSSSPLSFNNSPYPTQLMTKDGTSSGTAITNINHVSTSDWFTLLVDVAGQTNI